MSTPADLLRSQILRLTREYSRIVHASNRPGDDPLHPAMQTSAADADLVVPYAGRVFDEDEVEAAVGSVLDFWLTLGEHGDALQRDLADFLSVRKSANLLAISALTSAKLPKEQRLCPGDEVITCAAGFPTTVTPIVQNDAVPVFLDNDPITGNVNATDLESAFVEGKTKAVVLAHTLGNPFDVARVTEFCQRHRLWLVEDNCDSLGSTYTMPDGVTRYTGAFGDLSTQSFYPPHHLTMGEGGAVNIVRDAKLKVLVESFRDWGRDCWCASGVDNTCGKRFGWQLGDLPEGYDHKYIYSHLGYNLKPLDTQAAIGRQQLGKLAQFIQARKANWLFLRQGLAELSEFFEFSMPTHATAWTGDGFAWDDSGCRVDCSWFGFMLLVRPTAPFSRSEFAKHLDSCRIGNRMLFGGNLVRQPAFVQLRKDNPAAFRVIGDLKGANRIMNEAVFIGVYPGLAARQLDYMVECIRRFTTR
jgi:CDP-6-deoxy-D-xylo-4-hexulose-3-dehydrase